MSTPDMAAYLLTRIAEAERVARDAVAHRPGPWYPSDHSDAAVVHATRWHPDRVLVECAAKRRVVEHCLEVLTHHVYGDWGATDMAEEVLLHLVQVYADRSGFPAEWLPDVPW